MKTIKDIAMVIGSILALCFIIYFSYWVVKTISYSVFYESMVEDTVREMVKPEYLRGK